MTCSRPPAGWQCSRPADHDGPCAAVPDPDTDGAKLAAWLIDGAREILAAHATLDSLSVSRTGPGDTPYTLAARIAVAHDAEQAIIADLREALQTIVRNDKTVYDYGSTPDAPNRNGEQPAQGQRWRTPREIAQAALSAAPPSDDSHPPCDHASTPLDGGLLPRPGGRPCPDCGVPVVWSSATKTWVPAP